MQMQRTPWRSAHSPSGDHGSRHGRVLLRMVMALALLGGAGFVGVRQMRSNDADDTQLEVLVHEIGRGDFVSIVTEAGDIESASNVEVICEVKSQGGLGTTILEVVDEGTIVKEGDFLMQLDDSTLQLALTQQEIQVATDQAAVIQSQAELDKFQQTLNEYQNGLYIKEKETLESELLKAESLLKSVQDSLKHTAKMLARGYVSQVQFESEKLSAGMAEKSAKAARTALMVHTTFTKPRMVSEYKAEIEKQKALLTAADYTLKLSKQRRDELVEQIDFCRVLAPAPGQVVYRNDYRRRPPVVIEEGAQIRQGQVMFRLPDPTAMQVDIRINDSKISLVSVGDPAEIELDSDPDVRIRGELVEIAPFGRRDWDRGPIRYGAIVKVIDPPPALRTGQRAKVHIFIEQQSDVVQAPIQSVVGRQENHYCLVKKSDGAWAVRQVEVGPDNDGYVVVKNGLDVGEEVALNPDLIWDDVAKGVGDEDPEPAKQKEGGVAAIGG